ncbi:MAG: class I SAM-dependent methyltransferase [Ruminococcaceae bacterium]|nr:class I SAM-dependent methyltransferase [Oscillospiraceae bacterium]
MRDTPYNKWVEFYEAVFKKFGKKPELILDMGCGTGNITTRMADRGYDMIGLDASVGMLSRAREKNSDILYLHMDMTDFELYGTVDAIVSALDCINYVTEDIDKVFALIKNYLNPGGLFIFDINSPYKLRHILGNETIICDEEDIFYVWENELEDVFCHFDISFFIKNENGQYHRCDEVQTQRIYTVEELSEAARRAGLKVLGVYGDFQMQSPTEESERIFFVIGKEN